MDPGEPNATPICMVAEKRRFENVGLSWSERARFGGLQAVVSLDGGRPAAFLHGIHRYAVARAARRLDRRWPILDFGCGNGRFSSYFVRHGFDVIGTEITWEMLTSAKACAPKDSCCFLLTDGVALPIKNGSLSGIWCCGVLRYSLLVDDPCYEEISREMFMALRPGGIIVNCEPYVDVPATRFTAPFEAIGFKTTAVQVLNRYAFLERCLRNRYLPDRWLSASGWLCAVLRSTFDDAHAARPGLRDYLFVWQKPE